MSINAVILDSGSVSALANEHEAIRVALGKALNAGANTVVPTVVIAESTSSTPRDTAVNRILRTSLSVGCDVPIARAAAALRYAVGAKAGVIDAIVAATADRMPGSVILTGDVADLNALASIRAVSCVGGISSK